MEQNKSYKRKEERKQGESRKEGCKTEESKEDVRVEKPDVEKRETDDFNSTTLIEDIKNIDFPGTGNSTSDFIDVGSNASNEANGDTVPSFNATHSNLMSNSNSVHVSKSNSEPFEMVLKNVELIEMCDYSETGDENLARKDSISKEKLTEAFSFVYNFLRDQYFFDSLKAFEKEYEYKFEDIETLKTKECADIFTQNALLRSDIQKQIEFTNEAEDKLEAAKATIKRLKKERDTYSMHYNRAEQEKATLKKDLQKQKQEAQQLKKLVEASKAKYETLRKEKAMVTLEKDRRDSKIEGLNNYINKLKSLLICRVDKSETGGSGENAGVHEPPRRRNLPVNFESLKLTEKDSSWPVDNTDCLNTFQIPNLEEDFVGVSIEQFKEKMHFKAHNSAISGLAYNDKMNILATGSDDGTWKTWTGASCELVMTSPNQANWLGAVCFHPDGKILCTGGGDSKIKIWDLEKEICICTFKNHTGPVWNLSIHPEGNFLASSSMDQTVRIFDMNSCRQRQILRGHTDSVNSVNFHPFSILLATASVDRTVSIWDMRSGLCTNTFYGHEFPCNYVAYNTIANWLISCDCGGIVKIWDIRVNQCLISLDVGPSSANKCTTDKGDDYLYIAADDNMLKIFNLSDKVFVRSFYHDSAVKSVVVNKDIIYTSLSDGDVYVWGV